MDNQDQTLLKVIHPGTIIIGDMKIPCAVLENGQRVLSETGISNAILGTRSGASRKQAKANKEVGTPIPVFLAPNNLKPFVSADLIDGALTLIKYKHNNRIISGYDATILPVVCDIWLKAREVNALQKQQLDKAFKAEVLMRGLAHTGIIALVDEATGYQYERERNELQKILSVYIASEFLDWALMFPDEFYQEIYRLRGWEYKGKAKTPYIGKITNWLIYHRLPEGVLKELKRLNPIVNKETRYRRNNIWQRLSKEQGVRHLEMLISTATTMMRGFTIWDEFEGVYRKSFDVPKESTIDKPVVENNNLI